jgi:hypothetical protein
MSSILVALRRLVVSAPGTVRPGAALAGVVVAVLAVSTATVAYVRSSPVPDTAAVALGSGALPPELVGAVQWDFLLIAGYGLALALAAVLGRVVFWTPAARFLATALAPLAAVAVLADLAENALLLAASDGAGTGLRHVISAFAVLKFCALLPAAVIAFFVLSVTVARLWSHARPGATTPVMAADALFPGTTPPSGQDPGAARRWRQGYTVPDLTDEEADLRAATGDAVGICLSGGGVRSATVALGALQRLHVLHTARYLVSVSGGGYTAGALQLALTRASDEEHPVPGTVLHDAESALLPGSVEEDHIRRHASYLASSPAELLLALGVVARGLLLSLIVLFGPALVLGVVLGRLYQAVPLTPWNPDAWPDVRVGALLCLAVLALVAMSAYFAMLLIDGFTHRSSDRVRGVAQGVTAFGVLVAVLTLGVPALVFAASSVLDSAPSAVTVGGPLGSVVLTYVAVLASFSGKGGRGERARSLLRRGKDLPVGAVPRRALRLLLVTVSLLLLAGAWLLLLGGAAANGDRPGALAVAGGAALALLLLGGALDQSSLSLHPFYRRRLARAFSVRRVLSEGDVTARAYDFAERTRLSTYGVRPPADEHGRRIPEVIFSAAANLTGENKTPTDAVGFTFTGRWVGGPDVGYVRTGALEEVVSPRMKRDLTVQAAVAVSGAAISSAMGRAGRWYSTLFAVTGVRLGTWLPNPRFVSTFTAAERDWAAPGLPSLRRLTYLFREIVGSHRCEDRLLQITDGGHYENLGLVELLRRRCTEIYCIDASGDQPPTAGTFEQAITPGPGGARRQHHLRRGRSVVPRPGQWHRAPALRGAQRRERSPREALRREGHDHLPPRRAG